MIARPEDLSCAPSVGEIASAQDATGRPVHHGWAAAGGRRRWMAPFMLALLAERPAHGYALIQRLRAIGVSDGEIDVGQVYRTLRCLETLGHVRSDWCSEPTSARRREYELTEAGRRALEEWAAVMAERRRLIDEFETCVARSEGEEHDRSGHDPGGARDVPQMAR